MFYDANGVLISILNAVSTSPSSPPQDAAAIYDGDRNTKWVDDAFGANGGSTLTFELLSGSAPTSYEYITANDDRMRDPTGWTIDKLIGGAGRGGVGGGGAITGREPIPALSNFIPPGGRMTATGTIYFVAPSPPPSPPSPPPLSRQCGCASLRNGATPFDQAFCVKGLAESGRIVCSTVSGGGSNPCPSDHWLCEPAGNAATSPPTCADTKKPKRCQKFKAKGKCRKARAAMRKCKATCNMCPWG